MPDGLRSKIQTETLPDCQSSTGNSPTGPKGNYDIDCRRLTEKLVDDIYLIPVLLDDDVQIPEQLKHLQSIRASEPNCNEQIADALNYQLERLGVERREIQEKEQVYWAFNTKRSNRTEARIVSFIGFLS